MINLKLAEYKDGKFQSFLEHFAYCKNYIIVTKHGLIEEYIRSEDFIDIDDCFFKDEKDPLNRFNGLFDGKTYGEGRFVLIENDNFSIYQQKFFCKNMEKFGYGLSLNEKISYSCSLNDFYKFGNRYINTTFPEKIGNLFENPELYEKIKNI